MKSFKKFIKEASGFPTGPVGENPSNVGGTVDVNPLVVLLIYHCHNSVDVLVKMKILRIMSF